MNTGIALALTMLWFLGPLLQYHYSIIAQYRFFLLRKQTGTPKPQNMGILMILRAYIFDISQTLHSFLGIEQWRNVVIVRLVQLIYQALTVLIRHHGERSGCSED